MLKKLSVLKPPKHEHEPTYNYRNSIDSKNFQFYQSFVGNSYRASIDEEALLKREDPFYYHGNPIYRFEDLIKFVEFDVSRGKVPREKVTEHVFDPLLEKEIEKVRNRNNRDS